MANPNVETVTSGADRAKVALAVALVIAGIAGFYALSQQPMALRVGVILLGVAAAVAVGWFSEPGRRFLVFARESWAEAQRVVFPDRRETTQMTLTVFGFVVLSAIFLWVVDKSLEWVLYDLVLGWKR